MKYRPWVIVAVFAYVWLMVGFATGTATLLGPAQWLTGALRGEGLRQQWEDYAMIGVILTYLLASFFLARWLVQRMLRTRRRAIRVAIPALATAMAGLAAWGWSRPALLAAAAGGGELESVELASGAEFVFGAYPDPARLEDLKESGFTGVISLQHPAVVVERAGIGLERKTASELGLRFVHAPMLPWIADNTAALQEIRSLAESAAGRWYVHCGLGRDRVNVVRHMLAKQGARVRLAETIRQASSLADRRLPFERGAVLWLEPNAWVIPYPNEPEFFGYLLAGQVEHVVLVLDPTNATQRHWLARSEELLRAHQVPFTSMPLSAGDGAAAEEVARKVRRSPRPVAVMAPFTPPDGRSDAAIAFLQAYAQTSGPVAEPPPR